MPQNSILIPMSFAFVPYRAFLSIVACVLLMSPVAQAQELVQDEVSIFKARVTEVVEESREIVPGTEVEQVFQTLTIELLEGPNAGELVTMQNDYTPLKAGERFYVMHTVSLLEGTNYYNVHERDRTVPLIILTLMFVAVVVLFGGKQGIRGLISLIASIGFIGFLLLPGIVQGYSPVLVAIGVSSLIVVIGSYVTHGLTKTTTSAVFGMIATIGITGSLAYFAIWLTQLEGWSGEEVTYLNLSYGGELDLAGLLLGGILIGLLGVLYDAAIGQAVTVEEIARAGGHLTKREVYLRVLRIGREHVGALVNTLAIAYVGASLPLLLLFYGTETLSLGATASREFIATEIVRILVGSIGLVLAVPITTFVAVQMLMRGELPPPSTTAHAHSHTH